MAFVKDKEKEKEEKFNSDLKSLDASIENNTHNVYFLWGREKSLKYTYRDKIIDKYLDVASRDMNLSIFNKDNYDSNELNNAISSVPFFAEKRIVILDEVNASSREELNDALNNVEEQTIVIVLEDGNKDGEDDNKKVSFDAKKFSKDKDKMFFLSFDKATGDIVFEKILSITNEYDVKISKENMTYLKERCLSDLSKIENETNKLTMYALDKKEITKEDINLLVEENLDEQVFNLINNLTNKNMTGVQKIYKSLIYKGISNREIMNLLIWQFTTLYEFKLGLESKIQTNEIKTTLEIKTDFQVKNYYALVSHMKLSDLKKIVIMCNDVIMGFNKGDDNFDLLLDKIINL